MPPLKPLPTIWRISLADLRATAETVMVTCRGCRHVAHLPLARLIDRHGPDVWLAELWRRWKCGRCGSDDVMVATVGRP